MNHSKHIPYHTWTIFSGVTNFESYAEKFVVKGRFQKDRAAPAKKTVTVNSRRHGRDEDNFQISLSHICQTYAGAAHLILSI
jgi:hypothetical protein